MPSDSTYLSQCGEYLVAAELNRRKIFATVTYGNLKSMDVVALAEDGRFASIEVKTSRTKWFQTGLTKQKQKTFQKNKFWILVSLDFATSEVPRDFYVLTDAEIKTEQAKSDAIYDAKYSQKHGKSYEKDGFPKIEKRHLQAFKDRWSIIHTFLDDKNG